ncbi:MAG TPA: hypothetical protein PLR26_05390 [Bacilli bacterium]|nr:hypothetical protein [Bacilli bacterium]
MKSKKFFIALVIIAFFVMATSSHLANARMSKIVSVHAGYNYSGLIDDRGSIYIFGNGNIQKTEFTKRDFSKEIPIKIAFSKTSTYVLTDKGNVYYWGEDPNDFGILPQADNTPVSSPKQVVKAFFLNETVIDIAASDHHVIVTTETGKAFGWGTNLFGELLSVTAMERTPVQLNVGVAKVVSVYVSEQTTAFIDRTGNLWMAGNNSNNQLGSSKDSFAFSKTLKKVTPMTNFQYATDVALGNDFTVAINNSGRMISFGNTEDGRLGIASLEQNILPTIVSDDMEYVFQVSSFENGVISIGSTGKAYAFGSSDYGVIAQGQNNTIIPLPSLVQNAHQYNIMQISTGTHHAIALTTNHDVLVWGNNEQMQLGTTGLMNYFAYPIPIITHQKSHFFTYFISILILVAIVFDEIIFTIVYYEKERNVLLSTHMKLLK